LDASLKHLLEAKKLVENSKHVRLFLINEIRLAQTYQFLRQFEKAEAIYLFIEAYIAKQPEHQNLLHFVYQHKGKNYFEQRQYDLAATYISKALALRKALSDGSLVESSVFALKVIRRKPKYEKMTFLGEMSFF